MHQKILAALLLAVALQAHAATPLTFYKNIAPIIYQNCSTCHRPNESAPFSLLTYEDVKHHAQQIAAVTKQRYMPPWLPEDGHLQFEEERHLTNAQIQLIQDWVKQGAVAGREADAPPVPKFASEWALGKPDIILKVDQPYHLAADGPEIFWNFVLPVPITETRWVKAMEVRPGNQKVFHHANVIITQGDSYRMREARTRGGKHPPPNP